MILNFILKKIVNYMHWSFACLDIVVFTVAIFIICCCTRNNQDMV